MSGNQKGSEQGRRRRRERRLRPEQHRSRLEGGPRPHEGDRCPTMSIPSILCTYFSTHTAFGLYTRSYVVSAHRPSDSPLDYRGFMTRGCSEGIHLSGRRRARLTASLSICDPSPTLPPTLRILERCTARACRWFWRN